MESKLLSVGFRYVCSGTWADNGKSWATSNPGIQVIGSGARYLSLGNVTMTNPGIQAIYNWVWVLGLRYLGSRRKIVAFNGGSWAQILLLGKRWLLRGIMTPIVSAIIVFCGFDVWYDCRFLPDSIER